MRASAKTGTPSAKRREHCVRRGPRVLSPQRGQALLEVALVTPLLLLLLVGSIELGRYAYFGILVGNAARAGAAYGAQSNGQSADAPSICNAASNDFQGSSVPCTGTQSVGSNGTITITSSNSCACDNGGTLSNGTTLCSTKVNPGITTTITACGTSGGHWVVMIAVTASGTFTPLFKYPGISNSITISRTSTMRVSG